MLLFIVVIYLSFNFCCEECWDVITARGCVFDDDRYVTPLEEVIL